MTVSASGSATVNVGAAAKPSDGASQPDAGSDPPKAAGPSASGASAPTGNETTAAAKKKVAAAAPKAAASVASGAAPTGKKTAVSSTATASAPISATNTVGAPSKPDGATNPTRSDMAVVSDTVYKIVQLIVTTAFKDENCFSVNSDPKSTQALMRGCSPPQERDQCVQEGTPLSTCNARAAQNEAQRDIQAGLASPAPKDRDKVVADAAAKLQLKYNIPVSVDVPFSALRFGIFRCSGTPQDYITRTISQLTTAGVSVDRIADRGDMSKDDLTAKGFSLSTPAEVLFDTDISSEVSAQGQLTGYAQAVLDAIKSGRKASSRANSKERTPLYLSVAFCDS